MWFVALVIAILIIAVVISRALIKRSQPRDNYVCDVCGEHECLCRKENEGK